MSLKNILIILSLTGCAMLGAPRFNEKIKLFRGFSEGQTIERKDEKIKCSSPDFNNFICLSIDDFRRRELYINRLKSSCAKWDHQN